MRKPLLLCLVLILALGVTGAGYASWSESVLIRTSAASGELAAGIRCLAVDDRYSCHCARDQDCPRETAGIGWSNGPVAFELNETGYLESIDLNITGCCPCFTPGSTLEIACGGTLPAKIRQLNLDWWGAAGAVAVGEWTILFPEGSQRSGSGEAELQEAIRGVVLDPGQVIRVELRFNTLQQADLVVCQVGVDCVRWNQSL